MPNHYTTMITIRGDRPQLEAFKQKHFVEKDGEFEFDFNTVIPMPTELEGTVKSSTVDNGLIILGHNVAEARRYLSYPWVVEAGVTDIEGLKKLLGEREPEAKAEAERHLKVKEQTGFLNWYDWCATNWGTKWNAYAFNLMSDTHKTLRFKIDTAWAPPIPVLEKLNEMWPDLVIIAKGHDEGEHGWDKLIV